MSVIAATASVRRRAAVAWTPFDLPDRETYLEADNGVSTIADSGDAGSDLDVSSWNSAEGHVFSFASVRPNLRASDANVSGQPSVLFDIANNRLDCSDSLTCAWIGVVAWYPSSTFSDYSTLVSIGAASVASDLIIRGNSGTANWRTGTDDSRANTKYRNGSATDVAITAANAAHVFEYVPTTPFTSSAWKIGSEASVTGRIWRGGLALLVMCSTVPSAPDLALFRAYCQTKYGTP